MALVLDSADLGNKQPVNVLEREMIPKPGLQRINFLGVCRLPGASGSR